MNAPFLSTQGLSRAFEKPGIERFPVTDRATWLRWRKQDVTASVIGALVGVHDYATAYSLHLLKAGLIEEDADETAAMKRGRLLEPVALQLIREQHPAWSVSAGTTYYRNPIARIGATPDAFAIDPTRSGFGIIQIKTVEPSVFRKKWRSEDGVEPPLWIACQAIVEASLTSASWACVAAMTVGFGLDLHVIEIPLHMDLMARLSDEVAAFWERITAGTPPDPDYGRDGAVLAKLYGHDNGETIDLTGDNRILAMADEDEELASEIKERTERRKAIKAEVLAKLGAAAVATVDNRVVATAKTIHRKQYTVAPSSYRDVRLKRSA